MSAPQYTEGGSIANESSKEAGGCSSSRNSGASSSSTETADGEEQEDSSSSLTPSKETVEDALSSFRSEWQKELEQKVEEEKDNEKETEVEYRSAEEQARMWFLQGVENEQKGSLYEAIQFYKKAVQLVPDIEFRLYEAGRVKHNKDRSQMESAPDSPVHHSTEERDLVLEESDDEDGCGDLMARLERLVSRSPAMCFPHHDQHATHISCLPMEILLYILRWVVSYDLDLRSLEMCSLVSRGFYLCARDSEIWRQACLRVWGVNCGGLHKYTSWRHMYLERPRLNYHGCYISKTTYIRHGENSFQDQWYRPWHVVEYFRYLRFFPEGRVLMLTTPDEPLPVLAHLRSRQVRHSSVLVGHYRLTEDKVTLVLRRQDLALNNRFRSRKNMAMDLVEQSFHIELRVASGKCRVNNQLTWLRYSVVSQRGSTETRTNFDVMNSKFPPFWFSRVKSYTAESDRPLF